MLKNCKTAIILAGGKSKRMGFDKIEIPYQNGRLLDYQVKVLKTIFDEIIIVSNLLKDYDDKKVKVVSDEFKHIGPLAGLHVGLKHAKGPFAYLVACDMPFIDLEFIEVMDCLLQIRQHEVLVSKKEGYIEPFNAMYKTTLYEKIEDFVSNSQYYGLNGFIEKSKYQVISPQILHLFDLKMFRNINTQEDIKKYLEIEVK